MSQIPSASRAKAVCTARRELTWCVMPLVWNILPKYRAYISLQFKQILMLSRFRLMNHYLPWSMMPLNFAQSSADVSSLECMAGAYCPTPSSQLPCPAGYYCVTRTVTPLSCDYASMISYAPSTCKNGFTEHGHQGSMNHDYFTGKLDWHIHP